MSTVPLYYAKNRVAELNLSDDGPELVYDRRWLATTKAFPISLTMPLTHERHSPEIVLLWLANLLPESTALKLIGKRFGIAKEDIVGLVQKIGQDTAGAISIGDIREGSNPGYRPVSGERGLERIIEELPRKPFLAGEDGVSMSLAGVQEKLPVAWFGDEFSIPVNGAASTHILKPADPKRLNGSVHNEALCLMLAARANLTAVDVTTGRAGDREYLLVTRYDRLVHEGSVYRIHQEDFCQILGIPPEAKYENNQSGIKGPSVPDMVNAIRAHMTDDQVLRYLDAVIFNVLVCNTDAHAKNYSVTLGYGPVRLAPLYDIMCADCWEVTPNLAQTIGGKNRGPHIYGRHWARLADKCGLNPKQFVRRVELDTRINLPIFAVL